MYVNFPAFYAGFFLRIPGGFSVSVTDRPPPVCSFPRILCGFVLCQLARHLMPDFSTSSSPRVSAEFILCLLARHLMPVLSFCRYTIITLSRYTDFFFPYFSMNFSLAAFLAGVSCHFVGHR